MATKEQLLAKIRTVFPELQWQDAQMITEGWDHVVIILDNKIVFRFPEDEEYKSMLQNEVEVLNTLRPHLPVAIPNYQYVMPSHEFAGYPIVPGQTLKKDYFDKLSPDTQEEIAKQIAGFLTALHTIDNKQPAFAKVRTSYLKEDQKEIRKNLSKLDDVLNQTERSIVDHIMATVDGLATLDIPVVYTHGDIYSRHLLWDEPNRKLGVIDFSDMAHADPALDFAELHEYGRDFVEAVYQHYNGPKDEQFLERAWIYQCWVGVYLLTDYFRYHKLSWDDSRKTFDMVLAAHRKPAL